MTSLITGPALLAAPFAVDDVVTASAFPHRTFRRRPVVVTGTITSVNGDALTLCNAQGFHTVRASEARAAS